MSQKKSSRKGSSFEREICEKISLWWSGGENDAIFWRTSGSGARARVRSKKGKATSWQHGDIAAIDPCGRPLIDKLVIELKRGYNKVTMVDLLDSPLTSSSLFEEWIDQVQSSAMESAEDFAGPKQWAIIHKRDRREPLIYISLSLYIKLPTICPCVSWTSLNKDSLVGMQLDDFLEQTSPKQLMDALND